ncbi:hypothetical protein [Saccharothrix variisporea]|uniref:Uncharacterized protein n=1 Tax=Saccharothrix variisporea TaxID=543527 RepID=A0A495X8U1_9PSEU|nr:hypothetical protein [Saccharothrix variisporea]RKT69575.1 hypothetical protein DFJ66_2809 [Saccharothrix variisporea]
MSLTPIYDDLLREFDGIIESILSTTDAVSEAPAAEQVEPAVLDGATPSRGSAAQ